MAMTVRSPLVVRFERRRDDYCHTIEHGTDPAVGCTKPPPSDLLSDVFDVRRPVEDILRGARAWPRVAANEARERLERGEITRAQFEDALEAAWAPWRVTTAQLEAADALLDTAWARDAPRWPRRLKPFLAQLFASGRMAFETLVGKGCQPDVLALRFHDAVHSQTRGPEQQEHVRHELGELKRLGTDAREAMAAYVNRRRQLDKYFVREHLGMADDELIVLDALREDVDDFLARQQEEFEYIRPQIDGRRQLFIRHPRMRLDRQIHEVTAGYHDATTECILSDLRAACGLRQLAPDTHKRQRARWFERLDQAGRQSRGTKLKGRNRISTVAGRSSA